MTVRKRWAFPASDKFIEVSFTAIVRVEETHIPTEGKDAGKEKTAKVRKPQALADYGCPTLAIDGLGPEHAELVWAIFDEAVDKAIAAVRNKSSIDQTRQAERMVERLPQPPAEIVSRPTVAEIEETLARDRELRQAEATMNSVSTALLQAPPPPDPDDRSAGNLDELRAFEAKRDAAMKAAS